MGSIGAIGSALDIAMAESFYASLQTEFLDRHTWPTCDSLRTAIFDYIEIFYIRIRRHSSLDYLAPLEFERRELARLEVAAAKLVPVSKRVKTTGSSALPIRLGVIPIG